MNSITETGFLKIELNVSIMGNLPKNRAQKIETELLEFFKDRELNIEGKIRFVQITTLEVGKNYSNLNTSSK